LGCKNFLAGSTSTITMLVKETFLKPSAVRELKPSLRTIQRGKKEDYNWSKS